jgi:hypothetical protein
MLAAAGSVGGTTLVPVPGKLAALVGEADAALLLSGQRVEGAETTSLASLGPVVGLTRLARGEIGRDVYARQYGHRGPHEAELSIPRPAEDPGWIDDQLAALAGHGNDTSRDASGDADAMLARQDAARAAAWQGLARRWAADPSRRVDYYNEHAAAATAGPDDAITGFRGAAGVVEGTARVLRAPEDGAQLRDGEILVTTVTNSGNGRDLRRRPARGHQGVPGGRGRRPDRRTGAARLRSRGRPVIVQAQGHDRRAFPGQHVGGERLRRRPGGDHDRPACLHAALAVHPVRPQEGERPDHEPGRSRRFHRRSQTLAV